MRTESDAVVRGEEDQSDDKMFMKLVHRMKKSIYDSIPQNSHKNAAKIDKNDLSKRPALLFLRVHIFYNTASLDDCEGICWTKGGKCVCIREKKIILTTREEAYDKSWARTKKGRTVYRQCERKCDRIP